jgi:hypothetical protein
LKAQTNNQNKELVRTTWKAITTDRIYTIELSKETVEIHIEVDNKKYDYNYRIYNKNKKTYFKIDNRKVCVSTEKNSLNLNYCFEEMPVAVNEIVTLNFKRVE